VATTTIYLDTNIFLNVVYREPKFETGSTRLLKRVQTREIAAVTSSVTILEMSLDMSSRGFQEQSSTAVSLLEDIESLSILPLDKDMTREAAKYVINDKLTVHDAYHLATGLKSRVKYFITRDEALSKKIRKYLEVAQPEEI